MNNKIPQHIDPREIKKSKPDEGMLLQVKIWKERGENPFIFVRRAYKHLIQGNDVVALKWMDEAYKYVGVFYDEGTDEDNLFRHQMIIQRYNVLMLSEIFSMFRPEEE